MSTGSHASKSLLQAGRDAGAVLRGIELQGRQFWADLHAEHVQQIDSTNTELMRRAHAGAAQPVLLVADRQSAGRGRLGRVWHGGGEGRPAALTFSIGLALELKDWAGLSLAVGVSVAQSLHPQVRLKWPNDLWWQDRKLGGILIETAHLGERRYTVIGIGINVAQPEAADLATAPAWLRELQPQADALGALQQIACPLLQALRRFEREGFGAFRDDFAARDALAGRAVSLSDGTQGQAQGVGENGALLVHTAQGLRAINSAEVSVRPAH